MTERASGPGDLSAGAPGPTPARSELESACAALSDRLGGVVVALVRVDARTRTATPVAVHDPDPVGHRALRLLVGAAVPLGGTICDTVCATGEAAQVGPGGSVSDDALPDGWLHYSRHHGVEVAVALPLEPRSHPEQLVVVARRVPEAYEPDEIDDIAGAARALLAGPLSTAPALDPPATGSEVHPVASPRPSGAPPGPWGADVVLGAIPPVVVAATLGRTSDPNAYRPTAVLVLAVAALGLLRGRVAAATCAVAAVGVIWWSFIAPVRSLRIDDREDLVGLLVLAVALFAMWMLVDRVDRGRRALADAAGLSDALVDEMPVAFALAAPDRRLRRVNQRFADLTGARPEALLGELPSVVHPATGARNEALVQQVLDRGEPVLDTVLEADRPEAGVEHTWRANHFPIRSGRSVVGVGMTMEDITEDVVIRRRAQLLLRLSRRVAGATTAGEIAAAVTEILAEGLRARCLFAVLDAGTISITASAGYHDPAVAERWEHVALGPAEQGTLATSLRASELVLASIPAGGTAADGRDTAAEAHRAAGDVTVAWQPVVRPGDLGPAVAFGVAWPYERRLTQHSRTLLQTAASVTGLALARVELTEQTTRDGFRHAMDAMLDQVILARAIRDGSGAIVDFELDFANTAALTATGRTAEAVVGRRARELYPGLVSSGLYDRFCQVVETGVPWEAERLPYEDRAADGRVVSGWWNVQVMKVDDGYLAASRDVTDLVEADRLAGEAREALEREHLAVDLLQRAALPAALPVVDGLDVGAHYRPAQLRQPVGGDWYDAFRLDDGELALVVADVAGHGQEAAAYMVQVRNIFRAVAIEHRQPDEVLVRVDRVLQRLNEPAAPFVTCCYATLDPGTGRLRWALAGHPPPVLARAAGTIDLGTTPPGPPLATLPGTRYATGSTTLEPGDLVVLYTDGLVERRDEVIDDGLTRLVGQVRDRPSGTNDEVATYLAELVADPTDDIAILCVSRSEEGGR